MEKQLNIFYNFKILFLFLLSLSYINSIENIQTIELKDKTISLDSLTIPSYFKIIVDESNLPNYIKIQVNQNNSESNFSDFLISYYQDSEFNERKQFSQSSLGIAFIWLNKKQIKKEFYICINSTEISYNYNLNIYLKETVEISLNEQYTYYISEENKEMNFTIINDIYDYTDMNLITIWAKGNKDINTILDIPETIKHSKYNAYLIYQEEFSRINYNFRVYGEIGDIINVGSIFFELEKEIMSHIIFNNNEIEITGFLRKGFVERNCYKFDKINLFFQYASYVIYDNIEKFQESNQYFYDGENYDLKCIDFPDNTDADELFYSIYYTPIDNNKKDIERVNKFSPIQINGLNYKKYIKNGETIGLIPIMPDDDFNFLTYYVNTLKGKVNASIYTCETYPLCDTDLNKIKEITPINNYYSNSFSFSKEELNNNILSNINPRKTIMLITCENKNEIETETGKENDNCLIHTNIYTNKNKNLLYNNYNYHKYTRKNNEDNFIIIYQNENNNPIYINVELLSGDIQININYKYTLYEKDNKKLYIIENNENNNNKIEFSILAKISSSYNIRYYIPEFMDDNHMAMAGGSYLFSIPNNTDPEKGMILFNSFEYYEDENQFPFPPGIYFIGFYPLNCNIKLEYFNFVELIPIKDKQGFYQDISDQNDPKKPLGYQITKNDTILDDCLFYISIFKYSNETAFDNNGISLGNNVSQLFYFDKNYSFFKFSYSYVEKDKDINIFLSLLSNEKYKLNLFINEIGFNNDFNIIKDSKITIKSEDIKKKCEKEQQICKVSFNLISENNNNESIIEIKINTTEPNNKNNSNDSNNSGDNKINTIMLIIIIIFISLIVIIFIIFIIRIIKKSRYTINSEIENLKDDKQNKILNDKDSV